MIRHVVKLGHYQQFMDGMAAWNREAQRVGLPPYRIWESQFGTVQEVFTEAEFESIEIAPGRAGGRAPGSRVRGGQRGTRTAPG